MCVSLFYHKSPKTLTTKGKKAQTKILFIFGLILLILCLSVNRVDCLKLLKSDNNNKVEWL